MKKSHLKLIMELIFIFILPLIFICFTSEIQIERNFEYDNQGNYEVSQDTKSLSFDNSIINYVDGYKNIINNFNMFDEVLNKGTYYDTNTGTISDSAYWSTNKNSISVVQNTTYYFYWKEYTTLDTIRLYYYENDNYISYESNLNGIFTTPNNCNKINFSITRNDNNIYHININLSVTWANGNYVPYGESLVIYSDTDLSGQNNLNYTIWGNIKELLITNLDLNDNILLDVVICYMILWIINWIIWHLFYNFLELLIHIIPRKWERE